MAVSETLILACSAYSLPSGLKAISWEVLGRARMTEPASTMAAKPPRPWLVLSVQAVLPVSASMQR